MDLAAVILGDMDTPLTELGRLAIRAAAERSGVAVDTLEGLLPATLAAAASAHEQALVAGLCREGAREAALDAATRAAEGRMVAGSGS